jgi:hypothetical protein
MKVQKEYSQREHLANLLRAKPVAWRLSVGEASPGLVCQSKHLLNNYA